MLIPRSIQVRSRATVCLYNEDLAESAMKHDSAQEHGLTPNRNEPETAPFTGPEGVRDNGPAVGTCWGPLRILNQLGRGGFGEVYLAWDSNLDREVALKVFHHGIAGDELRDEGRLLARLRHPNVVTVYGIAEHDGRVGLWMEYING